MCPNRRSPSAGFRPLAGWSRDFCSPLGRPKALFGALGALLGRSWPRFGIVFGAHFQVFSENAEPSIIDDSPTLTHNFAFTWPRLGAPCALLGPLGGALGTLGEPLGAVGTPLCGQNGSKNTVLRRGASQSRPGQDLVSKGVPGAISIDSETHLGHIIVNC